MTGRRRKPGRLGPFIDGYRAWLAGRGYAPGTVINMLAMAGLGRWMDARDFAASDLDRVVVAEFRDAMRTAGMRNVPGAHGLDRLLQYLEHEGVRAASAVPATSVEELVQRYRRWLVGDRGLAEATVERYVKLARLFLTQRSTELVHSVENLTGTDIVAFLLQESDRLSVGSVKGRVAELRSLLKFLYLQGLTPRPLATVVPPVAGWRDTGVPKAIPAADVQLLLGGCARSHPIGVRDFAMLMLVARLGLRSAEVARLELGDIDWRAGQIILRGKASRQEGMPLPVDVGEALTAYLTQARPSTRIRQVFLAAKAPMRPIPPGLVSDVTHRACDRAGLPRIGAHRLRHSLATEMLRRGATIVEVSQVLRHRDLATTAIYAKLDYAALRAVARPWPGAQR